jgi:hypothetical protein
MIGKKENKIMASFKNWTDDNGLNILLLWQDDKGRIIAWADKPRHWFAPQKIVLPKDVKPTPEEMEAYKEL